MLDMGRHKFCIFVSYLILELEYMGFTQLISMPLWSTYHGDLDGKLLLHYRSKNTLFELGDT
jgi:hypothetical protein